MTIEFFIPFQEAFRERRERIQALRDAPKANHEPLPSLSFNEARLTLSSLEVSLAFPGPAPVMRWLSWGLGVVVGRWFGGWWLGLKCNYEEYFDEKMVKTT